MLKVTAEMGEVIEGETWEEVDHKIQASIVRSAMLKRKRQRASERYWENVEDNRARSREKQRQRRADNDRRARDAARARQRRAKDPDQYRANDRAYYRQRMATDTAFREQRRELSRRAAERYRKRMVADPEFATDQRQWGNNDSDSGE